MKCNIKTYILSSKYFWCERERGYIAWTAIVKVLLLVTVQSVEEQWRTNQCRLIQPPHSWHSVPTTPCTPQHCSAGGLWSKHQENIHYSPATDTSVKCWTYNPLLSDLSESDTNAFYDAVTCYSIDTYPNNQMICNEVYDVKLLVW